MEKRDPGVRHAYKAGLTHGFSHDKVKFAFGIVGKAFVLYVLILDVPALNASAFDRLFRLFQGIV